MCGPPANQQAASVFERVQACHKTVIMPPIPALVLGTKKQINKNIKYFRTSTVTFSQKSQYGEFNWVNKVNSTEGYCQGQISAAPVTPCV